MGDGQDGDALPDIPTVPPNGDGPDDGNSAFGGGCGQSTPTMPSVDTRFTVLSLNSRGLRENLASVDTLATLAGRPDFVAITETWLDKTTGSITLTGYHCVSHLDRRFRVRTDRGGVALFARDGMEMNIVHVGDSRVDERSWHVIHADSGPILLCVWYRPPAPGEVLSIRRFEEEYVLYSRNAVSCVVVGDMNVHNIDWLKFSSHNTPEGHELEDVCSTNGLRQHVSAPTRGPHLLDLVLSDFSSGIRCRVVPGIHENDHDGVVTTIKVAIPSSEPVRRKVYDFKHAEWSRLKRLLAEQDWRDSLAHEANEATAKITQTILDKVAECIPQKWISDKVYAHPWLNDSCREALRRKQAARGTPDFVRLRDACTQTFLDAYNSHVRKVRCQLKEMSPSSRGWWKLSGTLLTKASTRENIPPLQREDESWALKPGEKAEELARVFRSKSQLPACEENRYSVLPPPQPPADGMRGFLRLRVRKVHALLRQLDEHSGTGPDLLPSRVLKKCAAELALPVTLLSRKLLRERCWPRCWRMHWIHGIHKRDSKAQGKNYRGVHLTPQLSKVVERAIGSLFVPWMEQTEAFGPHQYAYTKGKGYKDVLMVNVCNWILLLEQGFLVGVYCSDVSGAFDRVSCERLCSKLRTLGLHPDVVGFLASWLEDRASQVVLGGSASAAEPLQNSVYQGTVLGSPLWNAFYADARHSLRKHGFTETVFADDLNCWKPFAANPRPVDVSDLHRAQHELHLWGKANQVLFDPGKESFHILHRKLFFGDDFKVLGCVFDSQLLMHAAARHVATEAGWRLRTLMRSKQYFTTPELMRLYKCQILSFVESSTPGLYHAAPTTLDRVDRVQRRFLREIGLSELEALRDYRLAPLCSRRDMGMLGALHKLNLGNAPAQLEALFPVMGVVTENFQLQRLRGWRSRHSKQLYTAASFESTDLMKRSLFGLVHCYNQLPQCIVDSASVKQLQQRLQRALLRLAELGVPDWQALFSSGWRRFTRTKLDTLFR